MLQRQQAEERAVQVGSSSQEGIVYKGQKRFALPIGPLVPHSHSVQVVQDVAASFHSSRDEIDGRGRHVEVELR